MEQNKVSKNEPAFPVIFSIEDYTPGLTKREHFAAMAMKGLLANPNGAMRQNSRTTFIPEGVAEVAVKHAEALIEELNKPE